jgi:hypothetical protein
MIRNDSVLYLVHKNLVLKNTYELLNNIFSFLKVFKRAKGNISVRILTNICNVVLITLCVTSNSDHFQTD